MRTEREKMLAGERYKTSDPELLADRRRTREPCLKLAALSPHASESERGALRTQPFGAATAASVTLPFICDYGRNIELDEAATRRKYTSRSHDLFCTITPSLVRG